MSSTVYKLNVSGFSQVVEGLQTQLWQRKLCWQLEMCQSSWEFRCELLQLQITVIVLSLLGEGQHSSCWGESFPWLCSTTWPAACLPCSQFICMQQVWCFFEVLHLSCTFSLLCLQWSSNSVTPQAPQTVEGDLLYRYINVEAFAFVVPSYNTSLMIKFLTSCSLSCWRSCSVSWSCFVVRV